MSTPSYYSSAGNFISAVQGGVDPRTGLYNVRLSLANTHANSLMGPALSISLFYSPLSTVNNGFGKGFRLNLSHYDKRNRKLLLSTGEEYRTDNNGQVKQQKLKNFIFKELDGITCEIIHKSGIRELLTLETGDIYVPSEITSADGRKLSLKWNRHFSPARLSKVTDNSGAVLCSLVYPDDLSAITVCTLLPENKNLSYKIAFEFRNELLTSVTSDAVSPKISWSFKYDDVGFQNRYRVITDVYSPTGLTENVSYYTQTEDSMAFPEIANQPPLPCVYRHTLNPGGGQPKSVTTWSYTRNNYLGYNADFNLWQPDTDQMLNFFLCDYQYGSTEVQQDVHGNILCTVTRSYNAYHMLASEKTVRDGKTHVKMTKYYAIPGAKFDDQPTQYALPKEQTETWLDPKKNERNSRTDLTRYQFDDAGNPVLLEKPDGTVINYTYYPAIGEENNCPADPHGFVRYLKTQKVTPPPITGDEPDTITTQTWQKLDALIGDGYSVQLKTLKKTTGSKLSVTTYTYYTDCSNPELFGRVESKINILTPDIKQTESFTNVKKNTYQINSSNSQFTECFDFIGYDRLAARKTTVRNIWTGNILSETSPLDIITCYSYDKLGRLISRSLCPGSEYENTTTWQYIIESDGPCTIETDTSGNKNKIQFDGATRVIGRYRYDAESSKWYNTFSCTYNSLGEAITGTVNDWIKKDGVNIPLTSDIAYNAWGKKETVVFSDGKNMQYKTDPITLTQTSYSQGGKGLSKITSGIVKTTLNEKSQLPVSTEIKHPTGEQYSMRSCRWDGLGRMVEQVDECGAITKRTYDEYGRVITQTLPDGTIVTRTYAPQFTGNQVASISVTGLDSNETTRTWLLGTQTFDSLGRLVSSVSGGRSTYYHYHGSSSVPSTVTLPSGKSIEYKYVPALGNVVSKTTADGINQIFNYDKKTGKLLEAQEDTSKIENMWSRASQLKEETFLRSGQHHRQKYVHTLKGTLISSTDVAGKQTLYNMDAHGRVTKIIDDNLTVDILYDSLGQCTKQTVRDKMSSSFLITELTYDSFGREIMQTITDSKGGKLFLSQTWTKNGLISSRSAKKNETKLLCECYEYDSRNRLIIYSALGSHLPVDSYGNQITSQTFRYDALNNLISAETLLSDNSNNTTTYFFQNVSDPTQLTMLTNSNRKYPQTIHLSYDAEGRMIRDEASRLLNYDVMGRLTTVKDNTTGRTISYSYDALNRLISQSTGNDNIRELFYRGAELINEINGSSEKKTRFMKVGHKCLAVCDDQGLTLTASNKNGSLLWSEDANMPEKEGKFHNWTPYGSGSNENRLPGFNGEVVDPISGHYHLGNGYRAYNPTLMRFNCPDNLSPFGDGGINPYAYCSGDPINSADPSGHISGQAIAGIVLGVIGIAFAVFTAGASIAAAGGVMAALGAASYSSLIIGGLGIASDITAITSGALEESHPEASSILGWVSLATGLTGLASDVGVFLKPKLRGMYRDVGLPMRPNGIDPPRPMYNVDLPELRYLREAPSDKWHEVVSDDGHIVFGTDRPIGWSSIQEPIDRLARRNSYRDITILSGTHGSRYGINWERTETTTYSTVRPKMQRARSLLDHEFYEEDMRVYPRQGRRLNRKIQVYDMKDIPNDDFFDFIVNDPSNHVILGYCYGRNDEALRFFMGLPPVISYVRQM